MSRYSGSFTVVAIVLAFNAEAIQEGFSKILPSTVEYDLIPMADGGEGTTEALMENVSV
jgi:glycerate kinase